MKVLTIVGPTAAGKTKISIEIARKVSGEIISADSRQIYKHLSIGTAKPTSKEQKTVKFHLTNFVEPDDSYSCGQYARDAEAKIGEIRKRRHYPIVCGGTGLYIRALFNPLHKLPVSDRKIKEKLTRELNRRGVDFLYKRLLAVDSQWAEKIAPKDKQRILRGLEVYEMTGKLLSTLIKKRRRKAEFLPCYIGINLPRQELYEQINERFDRMISNGLVKEVKTLLKKGFAPDSNALRTIGYKEIIEYLNGSLSLDQAIDKAKQRTRNFAKRQITWFNKIPDIKWYNPKDPDIVQTIIETLLK